MSHARITVCVVRLLLLVPLGLAVAPSRVIADEPGRGLTAAFEVKYLKFAIDHHFAALRVTELAAGTDATRDPEITPSEGTASTPGFAQTPAKATLDQIKSLARRNNRMQREEILTAQRFLREWYGIEYQPQLSEMSRAQIEILEQAQAGDQFNHLFLEILSRHHFIITVRSVRCLTSSELTHDDLERYCRGILEGQLNDIADMRTLLCRNYNICDYQPLRGIKGRHSGDEGEIDNRFNRLTGDEDEDNK
jgi:uncharacterized protein (DUF305 family)